MKILFACCNIGFGHLSRSLALADELRKYDSVEVAFAIGNPYDKYIEENTKYRVFKLYRSIPLSSSAGLDFAGTMTFARDVIRNFLVYPARIKRIIEVYKPDLIVSDSELLVPAVSKVELKKYRKPSIMITHQPRLFTKYKRVNNLWKIYLNKTFRLILVPDVVGVKIPDEIQEKTIRVGAMTKTVRYNKNTLKKKLKLRKSVCIIPSFASANSLTRLKFLNEVKKIASKNKDFDFVVLGQKENRKIDNVIIREMKSTDPLKYMAASDAVVLSGYTALMEAVMIRRPVLLIPTQEEQREIGKLGEKNGILISGKISDIEVLIKNKKLMKTMIENQSKIKSGLEKMASEIFRIYKTRNIDND
jgi:uncharacterized protein (TIGR00661 family)